MKHNIYQFSASWFGKSIYALSLLFMLFNAKAQTQLVEWDFAGFTNTPSASLLQNNGKLVTAVGQNQAAFISAAGTTYDPPYICNGWDVPANTAYFLINFSTLNYASNTITYFLGAFQFGVKSFQPQYSITSATGPWTDFGTAVTFPAAGGDQMFTNVPLPAACDNKADVWVRLLSTTTTVNTGGDYIDEIEVMGNLMAPTSISNSQSKNAVRVYPNPAKDILNVEIYSENKLPLLLTLTDMQGRTVKKISSEVSIGVNIIPVDMKTIITGFYSLQLYQGNNLIYTEKIKNW